MAAESRTKRAFRIGVYIAVVVSVGLGLALAVSRPGEWLENGTFDVRTRWTAKPEQADPRIVIIDVDNASLSGLQEKLGRWPWTRRVWTETVRYVSRGNPSAILLDMVLAGPENDAVDSELASVLRSSGKVTMGFSFAATEMDREPQADPDAEYLKTQARPSGFGEPLENSEDKYEPHSPLEKLARGAAGLGSINTSADVGGVIRREPLQFFYRGLLYPSLGLRTVQIAAPSEKLLWHKREGLFDSSYVERAGKRIPLDDRGRMLLLWHGDALHSYRRLPLWQVICSIYPDQCPKEVQRYPASYFQDKIVLVGASAAGSYEARPTPFDPQAPGVMGHATTIDNLLHGDALRPAHWWVLGLCVIGMATLGGLLQYRLQSIAVGLPVALAAIVLYSGIALLMFRGAHYVLPVIAPCAALVLAHSGSTVARYVTTGRELRRTRGMLERYIAPQLVSYVMANLDNIRFGGDKRELTILISDVRNFTTMTEKSDPMELISLLDDYLAAMTEIIFKYNGIVDKFIGDGILAYWGAFTSEENHAQQAAQAALEMIERLKALNAQWAANGKGGPISIGIGINTGCVIFGNIGRGRKIEFTVIGDPVNLASRLEGLNKEFHTSIIVSESTKQRLGDTAQVRPLGGVKVKGKTIETAVFELQGWNNAPPGALAVETKREVKSPSCGTSKDQVQESNA
jgi:adenylate cyclase